jgi:hypothetical protein
MKCPKCDNEMTKLELETTSLVPIKIQYKCLKCGAWVEVMKAYNAADADVVNIYFPDIFNMENIKKTL